MGTRQLRVILVAKPPTRQYLRDAAHLPDRSGCGHADSTGHPTHFIAINLNAHITIIEIPGGNNAHARIYSGPTLYSDNGDQTPVTLEFYDVNGDGKVDMIVHVGDQKIVYS